jgi:hypothetical protein
MELMRSLCLAKTGAHSDAAQHAATTISTLPDTQHDLPASNLARSVLHALPQNQRTSSSMDELSRYVTRRRAINA